MELITDTIIWLGTYRSYGAIKYRLPSAGSPVRTTDFAAMDFNPWLKDFFFAEGMEGNSDTEGKEF